MVESEQWVVCEYWRSHLYEPPITYYPLLTFIVSEFYSLRRERSLEPES
jgi:hypothetical protein